MINPELTALLLSVIFVKGTAVVVKVYVIAGRLTVPTADEAVSVN